MLPSGLSSLNRLQRQTTANNSQRSTCTLRALHTRHGLLGQQALGRRLAAPRQHQTARHAASGLLEGPAAAAQDVGELLLRRWVGVGEDEGHLPVHEETSPLRDTDCNVTVCATLVTAGQRKHVLLAVVITDDTQSSGRLSASGSRSSSSSGSGFKVADLGQPVLHWGCSPGQGDRWQPSAPGWSTWPDVSNDARHGAWQTPFQEQELPGVGPALTLLLQLPWEGAIRHGGLAFLIKTGRNQWLGNAATFKDFFFSTAQLPEMPLVSAPSSSVVAGASQQQGGITGPDKTLDTEKLSKAPPAPPVSKQQPKQQHNTNNNSNNNHHHHQEQQHNNHHHHHNGGEPELPNAGRREKEPANDETQVCTLSAGELKSAAAAQLGAWVQQQEDLQLPTTGLDVVQHEFPVKGHGSTPFVVATMVALQQTDGSHGAAKEPVLLLAALADVGVTGTRKAGLVLQWSGAAVPVTSKSEPQPEPDLPGGWRTLPDLSWDAGAGMWDTPMTRQLFDGGKQGSEASGMYMALLRLPLTGVFCSGGVMMNMRTARRQWIRHGATSGSFFVDTSAHAQQLGLLPAASPYGDSKIGSLSPDDVAKHKALTAAGLSETEIKSMAAANLEAPATVPPPAAANGSSNGSNGASASALAAGINSPDRISAALTSADAEMQAHIAAQSLAVDVPSSSTAGRSRSGSRAGSATPGVVENGDADVSKQGLVKFLKDFEAVPIPADDMLWGLQEGDAVNSDASDVPELSPHHDFIKRLAQAEHKAHRSLMHRYNLAADFVEELLPDLRAAAASAPGSLTWPPAPGSNDGGVAAMAGLVAVTVWLRFSSLRLLTWNHNYNVKPREISAALDRLGANLVQVYESCPQLSGLVLLALSSAGRGGEGDMGQRIRDEILAIQQRNGCKGGMMEEWHQKLHNNSSPDDLAICQALLDYLASGQQLQVYWDSLANEGITPERLASYDRAIRSPPPTFSAQQVPGLTEDLIAYRRTLAAVHSGADLSAAIDGVLGYDAGECKGKRVKVEPLTAVASPKLRQLLSALLLLVQGGGGNGSNSSSASTSSNGAGSSSSNKVTAMVEMDRCLKLQSLVVQARHCLAPALRAGNRACQGRLRDVLFLDLALEMTGKGALEAGLAAIRAAAPSTLLGGLLALLQQPVAAACMSALPGQGGSAALVSVAGQLSMLSQDCPGLDATAKARHALSLLERLRSALASLSASTTALLQPTANSLAGALGLSSHEPQGPVALLAEEVVRGSAAATLSLLLTAVEPSLRRLAGVSAWSVVSRLPASVTGTLSPLTPCLSNLPAGGVKTPTILVLQRLAGEEEVPPGIVGVIVLGDCPDVLSHCAVRARNCKIPVVACPSSEESQVSQVTSLAGKQVTLSITGDEVTLAEAVGGAAGAAAASPQPDNKAATSSKQAEFSGTKPTLTAAPASAWDGEWVLSLDQFAPGACGQKAMSTTLLHKAAASAASAAGSKDTMLLPPWVKLPASVALPHGSFEAVLRAPLNRDTAGQLQDLAGRIAAVAVAQPGNADACATELEQIRSLVHQLQVPPGLLHSLQQQLADIAATHTANGSSIGSSNSGAVYDWDRVWGAIKGVWASQWNSRAVAALGKAGLPLEHLRMGVLLQPLLPARYSWVVHTVNPATGSADEVCVQLVVGLGEVLVGNYPGRALGAIVNRNALLSALKASSSSGSSRNGSSSVPVPAESELLSAVDVVSYPSKDAAVVPEGLLLPSCAGSSSASAAHAVFMARSDSNAEDLPGFAGAGLFDSIPTTPTTARLINYTREPMAWNKTAAASLLWQCALAAVAAEEVLQQQDEVAAGSSRVGLDVEGCITVDGSMWVVQARPQV